MTANTAKVTPINRPKPLGTMIDDIWMQREAKRNLEVQIKDIEAGIAESEIALMAKLDADGVDKASGKSASVSISSNVVGNIVDWEEFMKYVGKSKQYHLVQKRCSDPAIRELFEKKGNVPGVEPFTRRKVNIRTIPAAT